MNHYLVDAACLRRSARAPTTRLVPPYAKTPPTSSLPEPLTWLATLTMRQIVAFDDTLPHISERPAQGAILASFLYPVICSLPFSFDPEKRGRLC
jgi:hypothetical protein